MLTPISYNIKLWHRAWLSCFSQLVKYFISNFLGIKPSLLRQLYDEDLVLCIYRLANNDTTHFHFRGNKWHRAKCKKKKQRPLALKVTNQCEAF